MMKISNKPLFSVLLSVGLFWATSVAAQSAQPTPAVDTQADRQAPQALERLTDVVKRADGFAKPFGHQLFEGGFRQEREDGVNPSYLIATGDQIVVRTWGAKTFESVLTVDSQGNIFIPDIGPIRVAGVQNARLNDVVSAAVRTVFTNNVGVYTNLQGTQPVVVYVTGFVNAPGSYAGVAVDSVLYFIERAGGIDLERGSFRDIRVLREGRLVAGIDLYKFLLRGDIAKPQFADGDTIVVGSRLNTLLVEGAVRNGFVFEFPGPNLSGAELSELARPDPEVSHFTLIGSRGSKPYSAYLPLASLANTSLYAGDHIILEADRRKDTMLIRVEGSHLGLSRYVVPVDTRLRALLDHIPVDPKLAATASISLRRANLAERQANAIDNSLRRLETAVLGASSQTDEEAKIRVEEAKLITQFVERAKQVEPTGVLVVSRGDKIDDVLLQPDDVIVIPERADTVLVSGEVLVPQALVYHSAAPLAAYINRVGGYTDRADMDSYLIIRRNAEVVRGGPELEVREGDEIVVLPKVPTKNLQVAKTITQVIYQMALATAIAFGL